MAEISLPPHEAVDEDMSALTALRRAAKEALELARRTNTPCWVMVDGQIVDARFLPENQSVTVAVEATPVE